MASFEAKFSKLYADLEGQCNSRNEPIVVKVKKKRTNSTAQENKIFFNLIKTLRENYNFKLFKRNLELINDVNIAINGISLIWMAVANNRKEAVTLLLKKGADPNYTSKEFQFPPLFVAIDCNYNNIIDILLGNPRTKLNASDKFGRSILMISIYRRKTHIVDKIIDYISTLEYSAQKKIINKKNNKQDSVVYLLIESGIDTHYLQRMLEFKDKNNMPLLDINVKNIYSTTPLHNAVDKNNYQATDILINNGANLDVLNSKGFSSLHIAIIRNNKSIVQLLLQKGLNINILDRNSRTALHLSMEESVDKQIVRLLLSYRIEAGIKTNFNIDGVDKSYTALMLLCYCFPNMEKIDVLLEFSKKKDLKDLQAAKEIALEDGEQEIVSRIDIKIQELESSD